MTATFSTGAKKNTIVIVPEPQQKDRVFTWKNHMQFMDLMGL
jgi:hypothetical protein